MYIKFSFPYLSRWKMETILQKLSKFWKSNQMDLSSSTTLLAVSGGIDSMLLARIFLEHKFPFAIAHMNYQLRGIESDQDADFVQKWANDHGISFHLKIDNLKESKAQNTQISARNTRYEWFEDLMEKNGFTYLATAHHLQDSSETSLINLGRGTGTKGLAGIPSKRGYIIRPLLCLSPSEKKKLCEHLNIQWREDQSNSEEKYVRNKIRHQIIPELVNIFPNFFQSQTLTHANLKADFDLIQELVAIYSAKMITEEKHLFHIDLSIIEQHAQKNHLLFYLLQPWDFSAAQIEQFWDNFPSSESRFFHTQKASGTLKGKTLTLNPNEEEKAIAININEGEKRVDLPMGNITFELVGIPEIFELSRDVAYFNIDKITWPLQLRNWKAGDVFQPFGMKGKHQKVQDYFSNNKYTSEEKKAQLLLCSDKKIIWLVGQRSSQEFAIQATQKKCLKATWKKEE